MVLRGLSILRTSIFKVLILGLATTALAGEQPDEFGLIEIYDYTADYPLTAIPEGVQPIVIQLPKEFRSVERSAPQKSWGENILTFYPSFTSLRAPENSKFGRGCIGVCNGRILISVSNCTHCIHNPNKFGVPDASNYGDFYAKDFVRRKIRPYELYVTDVKTDIPTPPGFTEGFEEQNTIGETNRYFVRKAPDGKSYDLAALCNTQRITLCDLYFSSKCNPALSIKVVGIEEAYMNDLTDIADKSERFVANMIWKPACR